MDAPKVFSFEDSDAAIDDAVRVLSSDPRGETSAVLHRVPPARAAGVETESFLDRLSSIAAPRQILCTDTVLQAATTPRVWQAWGARFISSLDDSAILSELLWSGVSRGEPGAGFVPATYPRRESLVGRDGDRQVIRQWLARRDRPLFALTGPGGIGKTRLAIESVIEAAAVFHGATYFVPLDRVLTARRTEVTPAQIAVSIQQAARLPNSAATPEGLTSHLQRRHQPMLIVLDNWEAAANDATHQLLAGLLDSAHSVWWLATSQVPVRVGSNWRQHHIQPLQVPSDDTTDITTTDAYRLFLSCIQNREPLPVEDGGSIRSILRETAGLPLSIELAAARWPHNTLSEIAAGMRANLLEWQRDDSRRTERQRGIQNSVSWSVNLLEPADRDRFVTLGIFPGAFTGAMATNICDVDEDMLRRCREFGLLDRTELSGQPWYALLPPVRAFCRMTAPSSSAQKRRFIRYALDLARNAAATNFADAPSHLLPTAVHAASLARDVADKDAAVTLSAVLHPHIDRRFQWAEGELLHQYAADAARGNAVEADILARLAAAAAFQRRYVKARERYVRAMKLFEAQRREERAVEMLHMLAQVERFGGETSKVEPLLKQALARCRPEWTNTRGSILRMLAEWYRYDDRPDESYAAYQQALGLLKADASKYANTLNNYSVLLRETKQYVEAEEAVKEALRLRESEGNVFGIAYALDNLSKILIDQEQYSAALPLLTKALEIRLSKGEKRGEAESRFNLGEIYRGQGRLADAEHEYQTARSVALEAEHLEVASDAATMLARLNADRENFTDALELARDAESLLRPIARTKTQAKTLTELRELIRSYSLATRGGTKRLVVVVPGAGSDEAAWQALTNALGLGPGWSEPETRWHIWTAVPAVGGKTTLDTAARSLSAFIENACASDGVREVILVAHSIGAIVARHSYLLASGAYDNLAAQIWPTLTTRIILAAPLSRGIHQKRLHRFGVSRWNLRPRSGLRADLRAGSTFITALRLSWMRHVATAGANAPAIAHLRGTLDDYEGPEDALDVTRSVRAFAIEVPDADHHTIVDVSRSDFFRRALTLDPSSVPRREAAISRNPVVFVLHGIRALNSGWVDEVGTYIRQRAPDAEIVTASYGYFSALNFATMPFRKRNIRWFQDQYSYYMSRYPGASFHFVGHSNGTYILANSLKELYAMRFERIYLAGSPLPRDFDWRTIFDRGQARLVRSDRAARDAPVALMCSALPRAIPRLFTDLGTAGFDGFTSGDSRIRQVYYFPGGHSSALTSPNLRDVAAFIVDGDAVEPSGLQQDAPLSYVLASRFAPMLFIVGAIGDLALGMGALATQSWLLFAGWAVIHLILLVILKLL